MSQEIRMNVQSHARYVGKRKEKLALMQDVRKERKKEVEKNDEERKSKESDKGTL